MTGFRINFVYDDLYDVLHNGKRVALLLPSLPPSSENEHCEPWVIYLDPEAYPDLPAKGLPHPLNNGFMAFDTFDEVADFLGIAEMEKAA